LDYIVCPIGIRQLNVLDFGGRDELETLNGHFVTNRTKTYVSLIGKVQLKKVKKIIQSELASRL
jgi:ppGpp synthetase/RelA/SpoT-type nucleotidyltranferase